MSARRTRMRAHERYWCDRCRCCVEYPSHHYACGGTLVTVVKSRAYECPDRRELMATLHPGAVPARTGV